MANLPAPFLSSLAHHPFNHDRASSTQAQRQHDDFRISALMLCALTLIADPAVAASAALPNGAHTTTQIGQQQQAWQEAIIQQRIEALTKDLSLTQHKAPANTQHAKQSSVPQPTPATSTATAAAPDAQVDADNMTATLSDRTVQQPKSCLTMQHIYLQGLGELSQKVAQRLQAEATAMSNDGCIDINEANALARSITDAYLQAGYFKVTIKPHTALEQHANPAVVWQLQPAKVVTIDNQTSLPTQRLFGDIIGKPANIAWMDQAVSNAERLIDGRLLLDVYPVGEDVRIVVTQQGQITTFSGDLEWYRTPEDSYGHHQLTGRVRLHNLLGQADTIAASVQQSLADNGGYDRDNQRRSASVYASIPQGRGLWSALLAGSEYERSTVLPNSVLKQSGQDWQANVRGDYVLHRDQDSITTVYGQMAHQQVRSDILGSQIDTQSPTLTSARAGISRTQLFQSTAADSKVPPTSSGVWVVDLSAEKGLSLHDNPATKAGLSDDYWRLLLTGYLTHQHALTGGDSIQLTHELQGQYSQDQLYAVSQHSLDGRYAGVRGLVQAPSSAASGLTVRNTVTFEPNQLKWIRLGQQSLRWSPYGGLDYGRVTTSARQAQDDKTNHAYSATVGVKLSGYDRTTSAFNKRWDLDVSASRARVNETGNNQTAKDQNTEVAAAFKVYF